MPNPARIGLSVAIAAAAFALAACSSSQSSGPDNLAAIQDIQSHRSGQEVTIEGTVAQSPQIVRGPSGRHQDFMVEVSSGTGEQQLILVAHNVDISTEAPLQEGDDVIVRGELDLDSSGPVIHFTHHDPRGRHVPGFIQIKNGPTYD
jgi:RecG-like helicase